MVLFFWCSAQAVMASSGATTTKPETDTTLAAAMAAASQPFTAQEAARQLVKRHANYATTLQLEKDFYRALTQRDQAWLDARAALFLKQDEQLLKAKGELSMQEATAMGQQMGPCHQASTILYGAIAIAHQKGFAPSGQPVDAQIPANITSEFAKNMGQCELQAKQPKTQRLLGGGK
jgi:hypothetical protein